MNKYLPAVLIVSFLIVVVSFFIFDDQKNDCHIVFDAGSSKTELFIYKKTPDKLWLEPYPSKKLNKSLDSYLTNKTESDEIIGLLNNFNGKLKDKCNVKSVSVYATAGMRVAEQSECVRDSNKCDHKDSYQLRGSLKNKLAKRLGVPEDIIDVRTITGYEEGLYAWLALYEEMKKRNNAASDTKFGIAEMGGASAQIAAPCTNCDNNILYIMVDKAPVKFYSYSFLGLGKNKAKESLYSDDIPSCNDGVGKDDKSWSVDSCKRDIKSKLSQNNSIKDPLHWDPNYVTLSPVINQSNRQWYLTGGSFQVFKVGTAYGYNEKQNKQDIENTCKGTVSKSKEYQPTCFQSVYLSTYIETLNMKNKSFPKDNNVNSIDVNWTLGAALCKEKGCLPKKTTEEIQKMCYWLPNGSCVKNP